LFEIAAKLRRLALQSACAAGGYFFPLRRKKVTKKGATSLEEAIFFLYGNCGVTRKAYSFPRDVLRWLRRTLPLHRTQGRSLSQGWILR
jgi:hypothetical protein